MGQFHVSVFGLILRAMRSQGVWILRSDCLRKNLSLSLTTSATLEKVFHLSELRISNEIENCARLLEIKIKSYIK